MGIEPTSSAWKAEVIATIRHPQLKMVEREGFEPSKAKPADLQSALVDRLSISPSILQKLPNYKQYSSTKK